MRGRVPKWLTQVVGGLSDGKVWVVRQIRELPPLVRASCWLVFQAVLFKIQPWLWRGLVELTGTVGGLTALETQTQLLLGVVVLLLGQFAFVVPKLNSLHDIVESMESSTGDAVADGGPTVERNDESGQTPSGTVAIYGAVAGGAAGIPWGPAGVIGLAVLGALVGDEWERRVLET